MPLLPSGVMRYSSFSSKSFGRPPRQMMKVLLLMTVAGVISPTRAPVLDAPVGRVPVPASERLAVEDRFETRLVASDGFGPIALFGHVRRCALLLEARGCNDRRQDNHAFHDGAM